MAMRERDFRQARRYHRQGQNNNLYELHNSPPLTERNKNQPFASGQPSRRLWHTGNDQPYRSTDHSGSPRSADDM